MLMFGRNLVLHAYFGCVCNLEIMHKGVSLADSLSLYNLFLLEFHLSNCYFKSRGSHEKYLGFLFIKTAKMAVHLHVTQFLKN